MGLGGGLGGGLGAGNDGGVIAVKRAYMINVKKSEEKADPTEIAAHQWRHCALSEAPLTLPVLACRLGHLYNKDAVLEYLLAKKPRPGFQHLKKMKDLVTLNLTPNPVSAETKEESSTMTYRMTDSRGAYICPISGMETNGKTPFAVLDSCGCVFAEKALAEVKSDKCLQCGVPFTVDNVVELCPSPEAQKDMLVRLLVRYKEAQKQKEEKKLKKRRAADESGKTGDSKPKRSRHEKKAKGHSGGGGGGGPDKADKGPKISRAISSAIREASQAVEDAKSKSSSYASLFNADRGEARDDATRKNLFIRTTTGVYSLARGE